MNTYAKFGALVIVIIGVLLWLARGGIGESKTYYKTIAELGQMGDHAPGKRLRVGGDVRTGSIVRDGAEVTFVLHQEAKTLRVAYNGTDPLPDTFKDGVHLWRTEDSDRTVYSRQTHPGQMRVEIRG
jgi:cytochrome c-type biogenesis protein CcmE